MLTAKERFEKLGFVYYVDKDNSMIYCVIDGNGNEFTCHPSKLSSFNTRIVFDMKTEYIEGADYMDMELLVAVNKQCIELGWLS